MADPVAQSEVVGLRVDQLPEALEALPEDLLVLQQNGVAKKLSGAVLVAQLAATLDGHGGIQSVAKTDSKGLVDTFTVTLADGTTASFTVTNGRSISAVQYAGIVEDALSIQITYNDGTTEVMPVTLPKKYLDTPFDVIDLPRDQTQDRYVKNSDGTITVLDRLKMFSAIVPCPRYLGWNLTEGAAVYLYIFKKVNGEYVIDPEYEFATFGTKNYFNYLSYSQEDYNDGTGGYNRFIETEDRYFCYRISSEGEGVTILGADEWPEGMTENIAVVPDSVTAAGTHVKGSANYSVVLPEDCTYAIRIQDSDAYSHRDFNVSIVSESGTNRISNGASFGYIPAGEGAALLTIPAACPLENVKIYTSKFVEVSSVGGRRQKARNLARKLTKDFGFVSQKSILWNDTKTLPLLEGKRFYGVPYSSRWINSHFVGFEVSVETALNALNDPYSIAYDGGLMPGGEKWVVSGKSEITVDPDDPMKGRGPGYGLVCSAFTGLIFGNPYPQTNQGITFDSNYAIAPMTALVSGTVATNKAMTHCVMVDELYREGYSILEATDPCVAKTVHTNTVDVSGTLYGKTRVGFLDDYMYTVTNLDDSGYDNPLLKFPAYLPQGVVRPWRGHKAVYGPWDKSDNGSGIGVTIHPTAEQMTAGTLQVVVVYEPGTENEETVLNETVLASAQYLNIAAAVTKPGTYAVSCGDGNPELFRYYTHDDVTMTIEADGRAVFSDPKVLYAYVRVTGYGGTWGRQLGDDSGPMVIAAGKYYPDLVGMDRITEVRAAIVKDPNSDCWGKYSCLCSKGGT